MNNKWGKFLLVFGLMSLAFILLAVFDNTGNTGKDKVTQKVKKEKNMLILKNQLSMCLPLVMTVEEYRMLI